MIWIWIAMTGWIAGVVIGLSKGNRKLPLTILILGIFNIVGIFFLNFGWPGLSALAIMAVILHIANRIDSV